MLQYATYTRKSDDDTKVTEKSIQEQGDEIQRVVERERLLVVKQWEESKSAKIPGVRPLYSQMIRVIEKGEITGILCWHINRLVRNMKEGGELAQLLIDGKIKEIRTPHSVYREGDNILPLVLEAASATQYSLDLVKAVRRGMEGHFSNGGVNYKARQGYRNERNPVNQKRGIVVPDGHRFELIRKGWDMMLTGAYTPAQVADVLNKKWGYRSKQTLHQGGTPLSRSAAYQIFSNPFYAGYTRFRGQWRKGSHTPMVTEEEFATVQQYFKQSLHQRRNKRETTFTGLMLCAYCGQQITVEVHQVGGKPYIFYRCSDSYSQCTKKGLSETDVEIEITNSIKRVTLDVAMGELALENILRALEALSGKSQATYVQQDKTLAQVDLQLEKLESMWLSGLMTDPARYKKREKELNAERIAIVQETERSRDEMEHCRQNARRATQYACYAHNDFMIGDMRKKREIAHAVGLEYLFYGRERRMEVKVRRLLEEVVKFAQQKIASFEVTNSGFGSRKSGTFLTLCSTGRTSEAVLELPESLLSALREPLLPDVLVSSDLPSP